MRRLGARQAAWLCGLLLLGLALRLIVAPFRGFFGDLQDFVDWGQILDVHFFSPYSIGATPSALHPVGPPPAFGPLALWVFGGIVGLYRLAAGPVPDMNVATSGALAAAMKLPSITADLAVGVLIYALATGRVGERWALGWAALWVLSPVGMLVGAAWGQIDVVPLPFLIGSFWAARRGSAGWAGLLLAMGLMWKPQTLVMAPLPLLYLWRWRGLGAAARAGAACLGVIALICLPYVGEASAYADDFRQTLTQLPWMSANAWNLWWLLGVGYSPPGTTYLAGLTLTGWGWLLFAPLAAAAAWIVMRHRDLEALFLSAALVAMAFFVVAPLQHERYMTQSVPLLLVSAIGAPGRLAGYLVASAAAFANMFFVAMPSVGPGETLGLLDLHVAYAPLLSAPVALCTVMLFASMMSRGLRLRPNPAGAG